MKESLWWHRFCRCLSWIFELHKKQCKYTFKSSTRLFWSNYFYSLIIKFPSTRSIDLIILLLNIYASSQHELSREVTASVLLSQVSRGCVFEKSNSSWFSYFTQAFTKHIFVFADIEATGRISTCTNRFIVDKIKIPIFIQLKNYILMYFFLVKIFLSTYNIKK